MAQQRRLFLSPPPAPSEGSAAADRVAEGGQGASGLQPLDVDEAHYARGVLRLEDGVEVVALDGAGATAEATLHLEGRRGPAGLRLHTPFVTHPSLARAAKLTLLLPLPKGERADWMVEKLAELGCFELVLVTCARSASNGGGGGGGNQKERRLARLQRVARAAARQARHGRLPRLTDQTEASLAEVLEGRAAGPGPSCRWVADLAPNLAPLRLALAAAEAGRQARPAHALLLGPEGGLDPDELNQARAFGYTPVGLGPHVLRVETAAVAAAVVACQTAP